MEHVLSGLEPAKVFEYFEEICNIPHTSFHTERISEYLVEFAKENNLSYVKDETGNVVIYKPAKAGYENHPGVILQGHIDMVGAKTPESDHDFLNDPLKLMIDGDFITAKDTTLGGDNGIAVAYALAVLSDNTLKHPAIEAVFTVDEEVGLLGAEALDKNLLKGKYLLNMDSEDEGIFTMGCAGGVRTDLELDINTADYEGLLCELSIEGLIGGHSGSEIGTGRPSANVLMGRLLNRLDNVLDFYLVELYGGEVDNAICPKANAKIVIDKAELDALHNECKLLNEELLVEYKGIDDDIRIVIKEQAEGVYKVATDISREKITCLLLELPQGVIARNPDNVNLVETSLNLGVLRYKDNKFRAGFSIRSSKSSAKRALADKVAYLAEFVGGSYEESGDYPAWPYKSDSALRNIIEELYFDMYGEKPVFNTIHAGLECGIFAGAMPDTDMISFGPDMRDVHTYDEKLKISSTKRVYEFLIKLLEKL